MYDSTELIVSVNGRTFKVKMVIRNTALILALSVVVGVATLLLRTLLGDALTGIAGSI